MIKSTYKLYGVEGSYYSAKIRCYLLWKGIPFKEILSDRQAYTDVIVPRVGYPIVPIVISPSDETLQDSAEIITILEQRHPLPAMIPTTPRRRFAAYLMELYADEWLKVPALYYRWHYDYEFASNMMGYNNDPTANSEEQRRVGQRIASRFMNWPENLGAIEVTRDAVEASFLECLALLEAHFSECRFAFGDRPCLADCAMMGPLYAHLYRDPHSGAIVRNKAPKLCAWIDRMNAPETTIKEESGVLDVVPMTMIAILQHLSSDYAPVLNTAIPLLQAWLGNWYAGEIPRYAGSHRFTMGRGKSYAAEGIRSIYPFEQWKLQRVLEVFKSYTDDTQDDLIRFCDEIGASALLTLDLSNRLDRENFKLVRKKVCTE